MLWVALWSGRLLALRKVGSSKLESLRGSQHRESIARESTCHGLCWVILKLTSAWTAIRQK